MKSKEVIVEFSTTGSGGDGSNEKEYLLQLAADLYDALYRPGGNPQAVKDVKTKIEMAGGTVKILHGRSVPGSSVRELDGTFQVVIYHPKYFKQGYLIRLVGDNPEGVAEDQLDEKWSQKYKKSINCNNPKGFSQRAHCQGRKKHNEDIVKVSGGYELRSKKTGRNLGKYPTRAGAEKRERQVQYFKHAGESITESVDDFNLVHSAIKDLLPIAMAELGLKQLPKIHIKKSLDNNGQPSFGVFNRSEEHTSELQSH